MLQISESWSMLSGVSAGICWAGGAMLALGMAAAGLPEGAPPGLLCGRDTSAGAEGSEKPGQGFVRLLKHCVVLL